MDEKDKVKELRQRQKSLEDDRQGWERDWKEITKLFNPRREFMSIDDFNKGGRIGKYIYDGSPTGALMLCLSGLQGNSATAAMNWFKLIPTNAELLKLPGVKQWLDDCTEEILHQLSISNFYHELAKFIVDVLSIGTASLYPEWSYENQKLYYTVWHPKEGYIAENRLGEVDTYHRRFMMSATNAYAEYGDVLSDDVKKAAKEQPFRPFEFLTTIYPNKDRVFGKIDNQNMPFISQHIEYKGSEKILRAKGYKDFPISVWRWFKNSDEVYGRSPAHMALVDAKRLNVVAKTNMQARHLGVRPAMQAPFSSKGQLQLGPGGITYYKKTLAAEEIRAVQTGANLEAGFQEGIDLRESIEKHYFVDFWLMISRSEQEMTAREVIEKKAEKATMLGPFYSIMNKEGYDYTIKRTFQILKDVNKLPPLPSALYPFVGEKIMKVEYYSPLAQAQKVAHKSPHQSFEILIPFTQEFPEVKDYMDAGALFKRFADAYNYPEDAIRSDDEVAAIRKKRAEVLEQQQQAETAKTLAEAGKEAAKATTSDGVSMLDKLMKGETP